MQNSNKKGNKTKRKRSKSNSETQINEISSEQEHSPKKFPKLENTEESRGIKKHKSKKNKSQLNNAAASDKKNNKVSPNNEGNKNKDNSVIPKINRKKIKADKKVKRLLDIAENIKKEDSESSESAEEILINKEFQVKDEDDTEVKIADNLEKQKVETKNTNWNDPQIKAELNSRTLFVGNVATTIKKVQLLKFFGKFGKVHSVRIRCVTPIHPGITKRVAVIKKMLHPKRATLHCYVTFEKREDALKALAVNGTQYKGHHLRVQMCDETEKPDSKKAIFVGNLPFDAEDDELWAALECCGKIKSVRIIRNAGTGMGIGIGYVNFESSDAVELALQMQNVMVKNKEIRIKPYQEKKSRKEKNNQVKFESNPSELFGKVKKEGRSKDENNKPFLVTVKKTAFQGAKSSQKKKKRKVNKGFLQKMRMTQKIAPKSAN